MGFAMLPLYTHYLSTKDYGVLEMLDLAMSLTGMFLNMGFAMAFLKSYGAAESEEEKRMIASSSFFFGLGTGLGIFGIGWLLIPKATVLLLGPGVPSSYLFLSFSYFVMGYIGTVPYTYIRAKEQSASLVLFDTLGMFLILALNIYFIVVLKLSILGILLSAIICGALKLVVLFVWILPALRLVIDWNRLKGMLRFGAPLVISNLTMFTLNFSDRFFLQHLRSLDVVGIYAVSYKIGFMLNFLLIQQFNMMWQARMYIVAKSSESRRIFRQIFMLYSLVLILAGLGLSLVSSEIMAIMVDRKFAGGSQIIPLIAMAYIFLGIGYYVQVGMYLSGKTGLIGVVSAVAAVVTLALNYGLIRYAGMTGAAWATVLGFLSLAIGSYWISERVYPLGLDVGRVLKAFGLAVAVYVISRQIVIPALGLALLVKAALLAGFVGLIWISGVLSSDERATLDVARSSAARLTAHYWRLAWMGRA
jgi:O-antigen/teichoic acid export membrane protein